MALFYGTSKPVYGGTDLNLGIVLHASNHEFDHFKTPSL
jgi:hypothetical protein